MAAKKSSPISRTRTLKRHPTKNWCVGIDTGGQTTKIAVCKEGERPDFRHAVSFITPTRGGPKAFMGAVQKHGLSALERAGQSWDNVKWAGFGIPGPVNPHTGVVVKCPNLGDGWSNHDLDATAREILGVSAKVGNDAKVAVLGEQILGYGQQYPVIAAATLGTGIGGGLTWRDGNGKFHVWIGAHGMGGEFGHITLFPKLPNHVDLFGQRYPEPWPCNCGRTGCAEALAAAGNRGSFGGIEALVKHVLDTEYETTALSSKWLTTPVTKHVELIHQLADKGDEFCNKLRRWQAYCIAVLLRNVQCAIDASALILLGGMTQAGPRFLNAIESYYIADQQPFPNAIDQINTPVLFGKLGAKAGMAGCLHLNEVVYEPQI